MDMSDDGVIMPWKVKDPRISQVTGLLKGVLGRKVVLWSREGSENVKAEIREAYPEFTVVL
jgi:hypothetical protein